MARSALPSNALYDVQRYLRQKRATGAQVTPQSERAAWSGYFDAMAANSIAERDSAMRAERLRLLKRQQKAEESAAGAEGLVQIGTSLGWGALGLKGTALGESIGLGKATVSGAAPITASGAPAAAAGGAPAVGGGAQTTMSGGAAAFDAGAEGSGATAALAPAETGMISATTPYLGPAAAGVAAGAVVPHMLGFNKGKGELAAGVASGAAAGAVTGAAATSWSGPGAVVGAVIGAVAGGVGAKVK